MTAKTELSAPKRRTRAEVQHLLAEFVNSGMRRSEFCQSRGLSFSTLDRHLKKRRWKRGRRPVSSAGRLRLMRIEKYGAGGEKLPQEQMQLFELEPVVSEMIEEAESEHAPVHRPTKRSTKHPGRQELPANLPRVVRDYFSAILAGLADLPIRRLPDLTPAAWVARHS